MARSVNRVTLVGYVGQDPEVRYTQNCKAMARFSLATNEKWKGQDGEMREKTEWHRIICWEGLATIAEKWVCKGTLLYLEGRIEYTQWEDQEGQTRSGTDINVGFGGVLNVLTGGRSTEGGSDDRGRGDDRPSKGKSRRGGDKRGSSRQADVDSSQLDPDDIPF